VGKTEVETGQFVVVGRAGFIQSHVPDRLRERRARSGLTPTAGSSATTTPGMPQTVNDGGILAFAITPNAGYHILNVLVDGVPVDAVTSYPFTNVTANHTISATFALIVPTISITSPTAGTIWPTGSTQSLAWTLSPAVSDDGDARFLELVSDNGLAVSALTRGARRTNLMRDSEERGAE